MGLTISNLGSSGLDVSSIVSQLMSVEAAPQTALINKKSTVLGEQAAWQKIQSQLTALQTAASGLSSPQTAAGAVATSSNSAVLAATATAAATANSGALSLTVDHVATAAQIASGGFAAADSLVGAGTFAVAAGLGVLGLSNIDASGATAGAHTIAVARAVGAHLAGSVLTVPVTLDGSNSSVSIDTGSGSQSVTVAAGTYSSLTDLAAAVQQAVGSTVTVGVSSGALSLTTAGTGSAQSLTVGANAALGLSAGTAQGADEAVTIDGTAATLSSAGGVTTATANGISVSVGAQLTAGTSAVTVVQTSATTTLAGLANAITAAGGPASASVIDTHTGSNSARLVLGAANTGLVGDLSIGASGISGFGASDLQTLTAASDAELHVGTLAVTRSSNTVSDVIPGVTLQLSSASATPVTVTVGPDSAGTTSKVNSLVSNLNSVLSTIATNTKWDVASSTGGPLVSDPGAKTVASLLQNTLVGGATSDMSAALNKIGLHIDSSGVYSVDSAVLSAALASDPSGTANAISTVASALSNMATSLTASQGIVTTAISSYGVQATSIQSDVDDWTTRLTSMQARYTTQYANLSAAINSLHQQGTALASIIAGLPSWSGSSSSSSSSSSS